MLFNSKRETVESCVHYEESECPLCWDRLAAKHCIDRIDHWAHFPTKHEHDTEYVKCTHFESEWHLRMKLAYMAFPGWEIEVPAKMNGKKYLIDAVNKKTRRAREFVHTLNDQLWEKHETLKEKRPDNVLWIYDGEVFSSAYKMRQHTREGEVYFRKLLKPKASRMYDITGGLVHFDGAMYAKGQRGNNWFQRNGRGIREILSRFEAVDFTDVESNPEVIQERVGNEAIKQFVKKL